MKLLLAIVLLIAANLASAEESDPPLVKLQQFKPIYFLMGTPDTKIQLSFKVQLIRNFEFYFAYTQLMMWDLFKTSAPIRDVNYNPDLFYRINLNRERAQWLDLGFFEHESNGRDGTASREWNRAYVLYHLRSDGWGQSQWVWSVKAWVPYAFGDNSSDLPRYRGLWEFTLALNHFMGSFFGEDELALRLYGGSPSLVNPLQGGQELTLRFKFASSSWTPALVGQAFHGHAENLLEFREDRFGLRAGIGF